MTHEIYYILLQICALVVREIGIKNERGEKRERKLQESNVVRFTTHKVQWFLQRRALILIYFNMVTAYPLKGLYRNYIEANMVFFLSLI